ncbi:MAG: hypothetical protein IJ395_03205 [Clostridia bacterium]|nr:hypothetical protein [Clostridia bacterium]
MYALTQTEKEIEDEVFQIYAVEAEGKIIMDFTTDREFAEKVVKLLNENGVEINHAVDVIEDLVY